MHGMIYGRHLYGDMTNIKRQASKIANKRGRKEGYSTDTLVIACDTGKWKFQRTCRYMNHTFTPGKWKLTESAEF